MKINEIHEEKTPNWQNQQSFAGIQSLVLEQKKNYSKKKYIKNLRNQLSVKL